MKAPGDPWFLLSSGLGEPSFNMALDEALLESMPQWGRPVLRFYSWTEPAATFGYFQRYAEVERLTTLRPLVRRPTGGGLVPHAADWTYSIAIPTTHPWYDLSALESYKRAHEWIAAALRALELDARLAPCCSTAGPGQCFVGYEQFDVLSMGRKMAGAAQRRRKDGMLIQGSVQPVPEIFGRRAEWEGAMAAIGSKQLEIQWAPVPDEIYPEARADELVAQKYSMESYNRKK